MSDRMLLEDLLDNILNENKEIEIIKLKAKEIRQQLATQPIHECKTCKFEDKSWKYIECRYCIQRYYGDISNRLRYGDKWQPKERSPRLKHVRIVVGNIWKMDVGEFFRNVKCYRAEEVQ